MILLYILLGLLWIFVLTIIATQVIYPMFSDYKFFWIFTYLKIKRKYKDKINEVDAKLIENELKDSITRRK